MSYIPFHDNELVCICSKAIEQSALCGTDCNTAESICFFCILNLVSNQDVPLLACSKTSRRFSGKEEACIRATVFIYDDEKKMWRKADFVEMLV